MHCHLVMLSVSHITPDSHRTTCFVIFPCLCQYRGFSLLVVSWLVITFRTLIHTVIVKLEEIRIQTGHQWTMDSLRHSLREFMLVRSNAKEFAELEKPTTFLPVCSTKPTETNGNLPRGCIFCNGNHYDAKCTTIVSSSDRKTRLAINRKCFLCLRTGHMASLYPVKHRYKCQTCNRVGHHNKVICPNADNNSSARQLPGHLNPHSLVRQQLHYILLRQQLNYPPQLYNSNHQ